MLRAAAFDFRLDAGEEKPSSRPTRAIHAKNFRNDYPSRRVENQALVTKVGMGERARSVAACHSNLEKLIRRRTRIANKGTTSEL